MNETYLIVGLGNPGNEYARTPHNAGRRAVERFATMNGFREFRPERAYKGLVTDGNIPAKDGTDTPVILLLPETYMNASGKSVSAFDPLRNGYRVVVVYDDVALPFGTIKISFDRGAGGHNGVASIATELGTNAFTRIRIGVSPKTVFGGVRRPSGERLSSYVLKPVSLLRDASFSEGILKAALALEAITREGVSRAMNVYNAN
jgi:PTH1 family peptidyl-tRNA hydrolase